MQSTPKITPVGFKSPPDTRLAVEAMSIEDLKSRAPSEHIEKLQRADFYRVIGVLEGSTCPMVDFDTFAAQAGDWLLVRPGQAFRYDFSSPWTGWLLVFRSESLSVADRSRTADESDRLPPVDDLVCLRSLDDEQHAWMTRSLEQLQQDGALTAGMGLRNALLRMPISGDFANCWKPSVYWPTPALLCRPLAWIWVSKRGPTSSSSSARKRA